MSDTLINNNEELEFAELERDMEIENLKKEPTFAEKKANEEKRLDAVASQIIFTKEL